MTVRLEKACTKALNRSAVNEFYNILEEIIKEYSILPKNIYNMDEKGIQLGIGARTAAFVDGEQILVYLIEDGNRELVTIIEAVCADGSMIHPSIIFQGVRQNFKWGRINPCNARCALTFRGFLLWLNLFSAAFQFLQMVGLIRSSDQPGLNEILTQQLVTRQEMAIVSYATKKVLLY